MANVWIKMTVLLPVMGEVVLLPVMGEVKSKLLPEQPIQGRMIMVLYISHIILFLLISVISRSSTWGKKNQNHYRYFATNPDVRKSFDENKGYHLDYNVIHGEKFKVILTDLHQLIKNEGNKCLGECVVEGFNEAGFCVKSSTQGPSNIAQ